MQIQERGLSAFHPAILPQVEIEIAFHTRFELLQLEPAQLMVEVILDRSLADAFGQRADGCAHFHAKERLTHHRRVTLTEQRHRRVLQLAQRRPGVLHRRHRFGEAHAINDLSGGAERAGGAEFAGDAREEELREWVGLIGGIRCATLVELFPHHFKIRRRVIARAVAGLR